jgi:hypothetical protein
MMITVTNQKMQVSRPCTQVHTYMYVHTCYIHRGTIVHVYYAVCRYGQREPTPKDKRAVSTG